MSRRSTVLIAAAVLAFVLVVPAPPAGACSCAFESVTTHLQQAAVVFVGVAGETETNTSAATTTFRVTTVYKGTPPSHARVSTAPDEAACGVPFAEGRRYAVFATDQAGTLTTGLCSGTTDDLSTVAQLRPIAAPASPSPRAAPRVRPSAASRTAPIAVAGLLVALIGIASGLAVRASRRPRPIV